MSVRGYVESNAFIGAYVPPATKRALIDLAYEQRASLSEVVRSALTDHLAQRDKDAARRTRVAA
jgi:hypothetical protein